MSSTIRNTMTATTTTTTTTPISNDSFSFYQRRSSLTTACPPSDKRYSKHRQHSHNSNSTYSSSGTSHRRHSSFSSSLHLPSLRKKRAEYSHTSYFNPTYFERRPTWVTRLMKLPAIQLVGWTYLLICFCVSTVHLCTSFSLLDPSASSTMHRSSSSAADAYTAVDWDDVLFKRYQQQQQQQQQQQNFIPAATREYSHDSSIHYYDTSSQINKVTPEMRLSKMFAKSVVSQDLIRPYWFTSSIKPSKDDLTLTTVVELKDLESLVQLAEVYEGPISATLIVPSLDNIHHERSIEQLTNIRHEYETTVALRRYVDLHLFLQPGGLFINEDNELEETPSRGRGGGYQKARNMARFFSRTDYVVMVPVSTLWMTDIGTTFKKHIHLLQAGDVLVLPTFGFPSFLTADDKEDEEEDINSNHVREHWPTDRQSIVEWVEAGEMGLLDEDYELNSGPTSFSRWRDAREPYLVPNYDYKYGPIFISTRLNHPWCEERFENYLASCVYSIYLSGANLWVLPNDYAVSMAAGQRSSLDEYTPQQRRIQNKLASRYRMEQCVFYARQFDQLGIFATERAEHIKQECSKALLSLQKQKMISNVVKAEREQQKLPYHY